LLKKNSKKLTFWIIQAQENPAESREVSGRREWRSNTLAEHLADQGHDVIRWRSAFSHNKKVMLAEGNELIPHDNYYHQYISCNKYKRHIGISRIINHELLAYNFNKVALKLPVPDLIHVGNVPTELSYQAVKFGKKIGCPVIIDVRDLWPDIFLENLPSIIKKHKKIFLGLLQMCSYRTKYSLTHSTAITSITETFLQWGLGFANRRKSSWDKVFHLCIRRSNFIDSSSSKLNHLFVDKSFIYVLFLGNYGYQFDFETIIKAAHLLKYNNERIKFVFAGSGPRLSYLKNIEINASNISVLNWVDSTDLSCLLHHSDIGILPYNNISGFIGNIPNKFSEYLSNRLAIACGIDGEMGNLTSVYTCGFNYSCGNEFELYDSLKEICYNDCILEKMKDNALKLHETLFATEDILPSFASHLEKIASKSILSP
jgi:glycosyltransferase involved in cell wall biosynthesis